MHELTNNELALSQTLTGLLRDLYQGTAIALAYASFPCELLL
ncbi:MAG: hypothetical protein ACTXOO_00520 [Sodalis sp. (in: enterobacteria)]